MEKKSYFLVGVRIFLQLVEMAFTPVLVLIIPYGIYPGTWFLFLWSIVGLVVVTVVFILTMVDTFSSANVFTGKAEGITQTVLTIGYAFGAVTLEHFYPFDVSMYVVTIASTFGSAIASFLDAKGGTKLAHENKNIEEKLTMVDTFSSANVFTGKAEGIIQTVLTPQWAIAAIIGHDIGAWTFQFQMFITYVVIYCVTSASTVRSVIVSFVDAEGGTKLAHENKVIEEEL